MSEQQTPFGLYGRTSKDDPRTVTIETQQRTLREWVTREPNTIGIDEYWDPGVSGKVPIWERPRGKALIGDIRAGRIAGVAVAFADRFGRTVVDGLQAVKELEGLGAKLVCVNEGWDARRNDSPMYMQMRFIFAEEEHRRIRERMEGGKLRAMDRDNAPPGGSVVLGYRIGEHGEFILHEQEALLVLTIFQKCLSGDSLASISRWAQESGIPAGQRFQKRGSPDVYLRAGHENARWRIVKVWNILRNEIYLGSRSWKGRLFPCPQLIDQASFDRVALILSTRATGTRASNPEKGLLAGLFKCELCDGKYFRKAVRRCKGGATHQYYVCEHNAIKSAGDVYCPAKVVPVEWLDNHVWSTLEEYLREPEELLRKIVTADAGRSHQAGELGRRIEDARAELTELEVKVASIWEEQAANDWPLAWVTPKINKLVSRKQALEELLKSLNQQHAQVTFSREDSSHVLAELARLRSSLDKGVTAAQKARFIRDVWSGGTIKTAGQGRRKTARIHFEFKWGELVTTPSIPQNQCQETSGVTPFRFDILLGKTAVA